MPVSAWPMASAWISSVPSYVSTASRLLACLIGGYSSVTPLAPRIVRACLAMSMADLTFVILAMLTCTGLSEPASLSLPRCSASSWDRYRSAAIPAEFGLSQLEGPDRLAELLAGTRVIDRALQAVPGRARHAPGDAEPGFAQ